MTPRPGRLEQRVREEHRRARNRRSEPLTGRQMQEALRAAEIAVAAAQEARATLRGRTTKGSLEREGTIAARIDALNHAAKPLRREAGRFAHDPARERRWGPRVRKAATAIQRERRKLWKMQERGSR